MCGFGVLFFFSLFLARQGGGGRKAFVDTNSYCNKMFVSVLGCYRIRK